MERGSAIAQIVSTDKPWTTFDTVKEFFFVDPSHIPVLRGDEPTFIEHSDSYAQPPMESEPSATFAFQVEREATLANVHVTWLVCSPMGCG